MNEIKVYCGTCGHKADHQLFNCPEVIRRAWLRLFGRI